ncbi:MAG: nucleotide exchange factor GrpE [Acidobacteria bacterium]|jgi:molecular chaperone GrpE|nr:nucleotide exchange factor GrpE [Acidobacteriota bacterium]
MSARKKQPRPDPVAPAAAAPVDLKPLSGEVPEVKVVDRRFWAQHPDGAAGDEPLPELDLKPTYLHELEARLAEVKARHAESVEEFRAETRRIQERLSREMERRLEEEKGKILLEFVDVLDSLDLAAGHAQDQAGAEAIRQGIELVRDGLRRKLERLGLEPVGAPGERFDPNIHEAIGVRTVADAAADDTVVAVHQAGYRLGDRLVRPARVEVGRYSGDTPAS